MHSERASTSKSTGRPVTRWRRDNDKTERPSSAVVRSQNKAERPTSRRGSKDGPFEHGTQGSYRSATPGRNALARPPSASLFANRVATAGSRATTMNSGIGLARLGTSLSPSGQMNMNVVDRPITHQGLAGVRPGTTRGLPMTRQIQDKRYFEGLLLLKIREITQEIANIKRDIDNQNKERATFLHLDKRAKELATELTTLQAELADYNIVVDKMTSNVDKEFIEQEAAELAQKNERALVEIERAFEKRQQMEQELRRVEKELNEEKRSTERLIENMDQSTRKRYDELYKQKTKLRTEIDKMQGQLDELCKEQHRLEEHIALSPLKQEAVKLHIKIMEAEEKRDKLREEERHRLSPETERERLLQKIKQDNMDIAAAEAHMAEMKKQVSRTEQELEQLETYLDENQSEKQNKYKELRKREEVIEQFMSTYEENKREEIGKLEDVEKSIVERLQTISNGMQFDVSLTADEELAILNNKPLYADFERTIKDQTLEGLKTEHVKLQQTLTKLELLEYRLKSESNELNEKMNMQQSDLITLEDLDGLKAQSETKREQLADEHKHLLDEQTVSEKELRTVEASYKELKERLDKSDVYHEIDILDNRLQNLKNDNKKIENFIAEQKESMNYIPVREKVFILMDKYSLVLKDNLKSVY